VAKESLARGRWLRSVPAAAEVGPSSAEASPTDEEIIEAVARGNDRVAGLLYDRLVGVVDRTLYRVFGRRESDHDDLVQASFEQIVITLAKRRFAGACSLSTWASTVASHVGLNALRSRRRERHHVDRDEPVDELLATLPAAGGSRDDERAMEARLELERLRVHLAAIDPVKAETLFLHDVLGHDLAEVAVLTDVTVAAAQSRLVRGRRELLDSMAKDEEREVPR
jgi:RNA polymerase sigma-70 factor (ECF subfamily)